VSSSAELMLQKGQYSSWSCINGWHKTSHLLGEESMAGESKRK